MPLTNAHQLQKSNNIDPFVFLLVTFSSMKLCSAVCLRVRQIWRCCQYPFSYCFCSVVIILSPDCVLVSNSFVTTFAAVCLFAAVLGIVL